MLLPMKRWLASQNSYFLVPIIWAIVIAFASLMSPSNMPKVGFSFFDKIAHFGVYFILVITLIWAFLKKNTKKAISSTTLFIIIASTVMYGVLMEILQYTISTGRNFEIPDIIANIVGCLFGVFLYKPIQNLCT